MLKFFIDRGGTFTDIVAIIDQPEIIERLARVSAIEILADNKLSFCTMETTCKLGHNDFILCATRAQELINTVQGMMIKSESLSEDIPQA
jgi:hypothetical protein